MRLINKSIKHRIDGAVYSKAFNNCYEEVNKTVFNNVMMKTYFATGFINILNTIRNVADATSL